MVIHVLEMGDATGWLRASEGQNPVQGAATCCAQTALPSSSTPPVLGAAGDAGGGRPLASPWRTAGAPPPEAASPVPPALPAPPTHAGLPAWCLQTLIGSAWAAPFLCPAGSYSSFKTQPDGHLPWSLQRPSPPWAAAVPPLSLVSIHALVDFQCFSNARHIPG